MAIKTEYLLLLTAGRRSLYCQPLWAGLGRALPAGSGILPLLLSNSVTKYRIFELVFKHYQLSSVFVNIPLSWNWTPTQTSFPSKIQRDPFFPSKIQSDRGLDSSIYDKIPHPLFFFFFGLAPKIKCQKGNPSQLLWNWLCQFKDCFTADTVWPCVCASMKLISNGDSWALYLSVSPRPGTQQV